MMKKSGLIGLLFAALLFVACGPPTMESQTRYFQQYMDEMDALGAKNPQYKMTLDAKKMEFKAEFEVLKTATGEEGARAVAALNSRVDRFMNDLVPGRAAAKSGTQPGSKLGNTGAPMAPGTPGMPGQPGAAPGGKLGGTQPGVPMGNPAAIPGQPTGGSGFGGGAGTAPTPVPGQPMPGQPTGGSGFGGGGTAPAPTPAPVPVPVQPTGGSGFGGQ